MQQISPGKKSRLTLNTIGGVIDSANSCTKKKGCQLPKKKEQEKKKKKCIKKKK